MVEGETMREEERTGFAVRILERYAPSRGEESVPPWKAEARELMNSIRNDLGEDKARWAGENAARREEVREFIAQLRADLGKGDPADLQDMVEVDCGYCGGQGSLPRIVKCPVCWGKGKVRLRAPCEKCNLCRGTGHVPGMALTCSKCQGKGWIHVQRDPNACPRCGGSGFEPEGQHTLRGASLGLTIRERRKAGIPPRSLRTSRIPCELCQGSGVVDWPDASPARDGGARRGAPGAGDSGEPKPPTLSLTERVLAYVMDSPGVASREVAIIFDLSPAEADEVLQGLTEEGKLSQEKGQYYPPSSSRTD